MTPCIRIVVLTLALWGSAVAITSPTLLDTVFADSTDALSSVPPASKEKLVTLRRQAQKNSGSPSVHLELGIALSDAGLWKEARAEFETVLKLHPRDASAVYNLGLTDLRAAQSVKNGPPSTYYQLLDSAQKRLLQAAQLDTSLPKLHQHLGYLYHQTGDQEAAIEEFRTAVVAEPNSAEAYNNLGSALADVERYDDAVVEYKRAFTLDPTSPSILMNLDGAVRRAGKVKDLLQEAQAALQHDAESASNHLLHGVALYWDGDKNGALAEFELVLKKDVKLAAAHFYRGEILREKGQTTESESEYAQAASLAPDRTDFAVRYATTLTEQGKLKESAAILKSILSSKPNDSALHFQLARVLQKLQQKEAAAEEFQKSSRLQQQVHIQGQVAMNLLEGVRLLRANHVPQAIEQFQAARAADPDHPEANFYLGIALSQTGDMVNSTRAFEAALRRRPSSAEIHYNFGIALWQHQQPTRAIDEFRKAVSLRSDYGLAYCALGMALARSGSLQEGKEEVEKSRNLGACGAQDASSTAGVSR